MPHGHQMRTPKGDAVVALYFGSDFERQAAEVAAKCFNEYWGESMLPWDQVRVYRSRTSLSMPVDIAFCWMARWSEEREHSGDLEQLEDEMTDALSALFERLPEEERPKIGVSIGFFGGPVFED